MHPDFAEGSIAWEVLFSAAYLGGALLIAFLIHPTLTGIARVLTARTKTSLDDLLVAAISRPLFFMVLLQGAFLGLTSTTFLNDGQEIINNTWFILAMALLLYALQRLVSAVLLWYGRDVADKTRSQMDDKLLPLLRRIAGVLIYSVGTLFILANLGVQISPLLAGLGIGGLAVALALQPTLSNLFASFYVVADGSIATGDFIEIQGGPMGEVVDIGWRSTKIQSPQGNYVIIPNSKLADSIVTNYNGPTAEMSAVVNCGVAYESNLARVEEVAKDVGQEVINALPEDVVVKTAKPAVVFTKFGDSNIDFVIVLRATNRGNTFAVNHQLIRRLHARFTQEGIEINHPVRKLVQPSGNGAGHLLKNPASAD
ncbi:MAG: mechanosensitive ion channel family protein [SAR202 cluster bacterium]|nr:mechanosensitive ion channel family protein [SAR202 cluster bacterium]